MADFCRYHSIQLFGKDYKELAGITSAQEWADGYAHLTLCESCESGSVYVDPEGNVVDNPNAKWERVFPEIPETP